MDEYENLLDRLNLNKDGVALTYLYKLRKNIVDYFSKNCYIEKFNNSSEGVMIYKR